MDNHEKLATHGTHYEEKHNTICVVHHYAKKKNTNNVNKTSPPTNNWGHIFKKYI
jgi:hypothetical protein